MTALIVTETATKPDTKPAWTWRKWKKEFRTAIPWDEYQLGVFECVEFLWDNLLIGAVAGSGKSTLLTGCIPLLPDSIVVDDKKRPLKITILTFNRHNADSLKKSGKLPSRVTVNTAHGMALGLLQRRFQGALEIDARNEILFKLTNQCYQNIIRLYSDYLVLQQRYDNSEEEIKEYYQQQLSEKFPVKPIYFDESDPKQRQEQYDFLALIRKLVGFCQKCLVEPDKDSLTDLCQHFGFFIPNEQQFYWIVRSVAWILKNIEAIALRECRVSFDSLLWLCWKWQIVPPARDVLIVDEVQDTSPAQNALYMSYLQQGARLVAAGDEFQAINSFNGSDPYAWQKLVSDYAPIQLSLSVSHRCAKAITELARRIVADIQSEADAPDGTIGVCDADTMLANVSDGDLILCRFNAPLLGMCLQLIKSGVSAKIRGREIGKELANFARRFYGEGSRESGVGSRGGEGSRESFSGAFLDNLSEYCLPRIQELQELECDVEAQNLLDKYHAILFCYEEFGGLCKDGQEFGEGIKALFDDNGKVSIWLSTIHRAKGDEANRVFLLGSQDLPYTAKAQTDWQIRQEWNLLYVAITRAKQCLVFVPYGFDQKVVLEALKKPCGGVTFPCGGKGVGSRE